MSQHAHRQPPSWNRLPAASLVCFLSAVSWEPVYWPCPYLEHRLHMAFIDPFKALVWAAVLNGLVAAPLIVVIMLMASSNKVKVMGKFEIPSYLLWTGWIALPR
jgi:hypothetical protein